MAITEEHGLNAGIDGILGLGPSLDNGPSYMHNAYQEGLIDRALLSFSLGYNNGQDIQ